MSGARLRVEQLAVQLMGQAKDEEVEGELSEHLGYDPYDHGRPTFGQQSQRDWHQDGPDRDLPGDPRGATRSGGQFSSR